MVAVGRRWAHYLGCLWLACCLALPAVQARTLHQGTVAAAYAAQQSDVLVQASGTVKKILPDDNKGSRHQRFIVALSGGLTVLIAHNIDLAPRVAELKVGDSIEFAGEYEWNKKGGVVHWTHHDPRGKHPGGWLKHKGRLYR